MSQTLTISDELYARLEAEARQKSAGSIEQLLERTHRPERRLSSEELRRRQELGRLADELSDRIATQCGILPDSTPLVREDRER